MMVLPMAVVTRTAASASRAIPAVIETSGEGLCCGFDSGLPMSASYAAPFRFTGTIHEVVVELHDEAGADDADAQLRAAWADH